MIYIVTLINMHKADNSITWLIESKCSVGYFLTLDKAVKAITSDDCGMFERYCLCKYAVIEECDEGICGRRNVVKWFRRERENDAYGIQEINAPRNL